MKSSMQFNSEKVGPVNRQGNTEQQIPLVDSSQLFVKSNEIMIRHKGTVYRLRITRNDKLIMNK